MTSAIRDLAPEAWATVIRLPSDPSAAAIARDFVVRDNAGLSGDALADALIMVSELVTNAVLHGVGDVSLRARETRPGIGLGVEDGGPAMSSAVPAHPGRGQISGRGLRIIDVLASSWGVTDINPGKIVWFELDEPKTALTR